MIEIPIYLKECTEIKKKTDDSIVMKVLCNCGCSTFYLLENLLDVEEENIIKTYEKRFVSWKNIENYTDPITNIRYLVTRNRFGKIFDKIPISEISDIKRTHIIKVVCAKCSKEKVIYDNRHHGYNAIVTGNHFFSSNKEYQYRLIQVQGKTVMEVEIKIRNDLSYDEYYNEVEGNFINDFSNAFSNIEIYGIIKGKKKKIFEEETA